MKKKGQLKMSKTVKHIISFMLILVMSSFIMMNVIGVQAEDVSATGAIAVPTVPRLGTNNIDDTTTNIINTALTLLGIIALVIVLMGGFKWMTSAGNEEKVGEAKKLLGAGVIGLIIVFAAWAIASFIMSTVQSGAGTGVEIPE